MLIQPGDSPVPPPSAITAELDGLIRRRGAPQLDPDGALLGLAVVRHRAGDEAGHTRWAAFAGLMPQIAAKLDDPPHTKAALALVCLNGPLMRASVGTRRQAAANALGLPKGDSFRRRHETNLIADLARAFVAVETDHRHRELAEDLGIDWVSRFEAYGRIYTPIAGLRGDLEILLRAQREKPGQFKYLIAQIGPSLWRYTAVHLALDDFVRVYGGLWLFSDPEIETDIANAIQHIARDSALNEHDTSWLRILLRQTADHELEPFLQAVSTDVRGVAILLAWSDWCQSCTCPSVSMPDRGCEMHAVIAACEDYLKIVDREIPAVGQPARQRLRSVPSESIRELVKRFGAVQTHGRSDDDTD